MLISLKPLSHPHLGEIVIREALFPVGRSEDPFASYDKSAVVNLSRRQARIFMEGGGAYIADLGSRNGTQVNGKQVEFKPVKLLTGDRITFAGSLEYEVELQLLQEDTDLAYGRDMRLTLTPAAADSPLESIVINRFPFLVSKSSPPFDSFEDSRSHLQEYLSRKHAHIYVRGDSLFVEDLNSTNGTFVNGERVGDCARALSTGDELLFGREHLAYRVTLESVAEEQAAQSEPLAEPASEIPAMDVEGESHTIFISSANTFLDAFSLEAAPQEPSPSTTGESDEHESPEAPRVGRVGLLGRLGTFLTELKAAFGDQDRSSGASRWVLLAAMLVAAVAGVAIYYSGKTEREVEQLLAQGRYRESAVLANDYLATHPGAGPVQELATESLVNYTVRGWLNRIDGGDYPGARDLLADARTISSHSPAAEGMLDVLVWVTRLREFIAGRGGLEGKIRIYEHEAEMESILNQWDQDPKEYRSRMKLLEDVVPEFAPSSTLAFTMLRTLRNERSVYLPAIGRLNRMIEDQLALGRVDELAAELDIFAEQYPRLGGLEPILGDLKRYSLAQVALDSGDRMRAAVLISQSGFTTPPFIARARDLELKLLPSAEVVAEYENASAAWRAGELSAALGILENLVDTRGGEMAAEELQRKAGVMDTYASLQGFREQPDFGERVLRFHASLDPREDVYFVQVLEREFRVHSTVVKARADEAWAAALSNWNEYRALGSIRGLLRLEEEVSAEFKRRADLLAMAGESARRGTQIYGLLGIDSTAERKALSRQIEAELQLQRRSLEQLSMVLQPEVLEAKLGLLANREEGAEDG